MPPLIIAGAISGVGAIAGAAIGSSAAGNAADAQAAAANKAAQLQHQDAQAALAFQEQTQAQQQSNLAPWLQAGTGAVTNLANLLGVLPSTASTTPVPGQTSPTSSLGGVPFGGPTISPAWGTGQGVWGNPALRARGTIAGNEGIDLSGFTGLGPKSTTAAPPTTMLSSLINPSLGAAGSLSMPWDQTFQAPTDVTEKNDPGYQFRLAEGQKALERSAAAKGGLLTGGTAADEGKYAQDYASNEYGNVYNRALGQYQQNYNQFQQGQADKYNRLASLAGLGQVSASQLNSAGSQAAGNVTNILGNEGQQVGQSYQNAGAATASGYVGSANAWGGALSNLGNLGWMIPYMQQQNNSGGGGWV